MDGICLPFEYQIGFAGRKRRLVVGESLDFLDLWLRLQMKITFSSVYAHVLFLCLTALVWSLQMMLIIVVPVDMPVLCVCSVSLFHRCLLRILVNHLYCMSFLSHSLLLMARNSLILVNAFSPFYLLINYVGRFSDVSVELCWFLMLLDLTVWSWIINLLKQCYQVCAS